MFPYLNMFGFEIQTYWFMFALGVIAMLVICIAISFLHNISIIKAIIIWFGIVIFGLLGVMILGFIQSSFKILVCHLWEL